MFLVVKDCFIFLRRQLSRKLTVSEIVQEDNTIPGNTLVVQKNKPFQGLSSFGTSFLNKLAGVECNCELLRHVSLIDTPGVLSGSDMGFRRGYDYPAVVEWFAKRADMVSVS